MKTIAKTRTQSQPRKRLEITIDAVTRIEMIKALDMVKSKLYLIQDGHQRFLNNSSMVEFELSAYGEIDCRIEEINGKLCQIYRSKL